MTFQDQLRANIADIRTRAADFLIDTCILKRKTGETITNGESVPVYAVNETLACRLIIRTGSETNNIAAQERAITQGVFASLYRMQLPYGTLVSVDDVIEYTDTVNNTLRTFEVVFAPPMQVYTGAYVIGLREIT